MAEKKKWETEKQEDDSIYECTQTKTVSLWQKLHP